MPIWNPQVECAPVADRRALQLARLQDTVARLHARVPFYRDKLAAAGIATVQACTRVLLRTGQF